MTLNGKKIEIDPIEGKSNITPLAGLFPILQLANGIGLSQVINESLAVRGTRGYSDADHVIALMLTQLSGGEAIEHTINFKEKFNAGELSINVPSPAAIRDYMSNFDNEEESANRKQGKVFIPEENEHLAGFSKIHAHTLQKAYEFNPQKVLTLDQDATFINTKAGDSLYNYHGDRAFEALSIYSPELDMIVASQYRDGNVNPGHGQLEQLQKLAEQMPQGVEKLQFRSDSAGYQIGLLKYAAEGQNKRFGVIDFVISCPVHKEFREAVKRIPESEWKTIETEVGKPVQECAVVSYLSSELVKSSAEYRFIAIREKLQPGEVAQLTLDFDEEVVKKLHITEMEKASYKVFGVVTNKLEEDICSLVKWNRERCGKSEEAHRLLKDELGGSHTPSYRFGANALWWNIVVLALNLNNLLKQNFMPEEYRTKRPSTIRFLFYTLVGKVIKHARKIVLRLFRGDRGTACFMHIQERFAQLGLNTV